MMNPRPNEAFICIVFVCSAFLGACRGPDADSERSLRSLQPEIEAARATYSGGALEYLEAALDTLEKHHVFGSEYDWEELRLATLEYTEGASTIEETYDAIRFALRDIDDPHTYFITPDPDTLEARAEKTRDGRPRYSNPSRQVNLKGQLLDETVAYMVLPRFSGLDSLTTEGYVSAVQNVIRELRAHDPCGWIVDLRANTGGNMWPMLAGVGPLLNTRNVGSFVGPEGRRIPWYYDDGKALMDTAVLAQIKPGNRAVPAIDSPLAVLINEHTGSSGEAVAVAFRGRSQTQFFGEPTAGAATAHEPFELSDGAVLGFSTLYYADRDDRVYDGPIEPDITVDDIDGPPSTIDRAAAWIRGGDDCAE